MRAPLSRWRCKKRHKDLSWFGQEKALRPAGGSFCYLAPKCLYRGEYKRGMDGDGVWLLYYVCLVLCISSLASPFIVPRGGVGYMHR